MAKLYDTIIIGGGPAGATASFYLSRAERSCAIMTNKKSNLDLAEKIDNYYGFENGITGNELYQQGLRQASNLGVDVKECEVVEIIKNKDNFEVRTNIGTFNSKTIVLATGKKKKKPNIKNLEKFEGKGVSYCAVCDGYFFKSKSVAVVGSGPLAVHELKYLSPIVKDIYLFTNGKDIPDGVDGIKSDTRPIIELRGNRVLDEIVFASGETKKMGGLFIAEGSASSIDFANALGIVLQDGDIVINDKCETNVEGVYACGDITGGIYQVSKAVYQGMTVGLELIKYLRKVTGVKR